MLLFKNKKKVTFNAEEGSSENSKKVSFFLNEIINFSIIIYILEIKIKEGQISTAKKDYLRNMEQQIQQEWEEKKVFEVDPPEDLSQPKYILCFLCIAVIILFLKILSFDDY